MNGINFMQVSISPEQRNLAFKNCFDTFKDWSDGDWIQQIIELLYEYYTNLSAVQKCYFCDQTENNITIAIRNSIKESETFKYSRFIINSQTQNENDKLIGYYDLKFEHSGWIDNFFAFECKPLTNSKKRLDAYIYNQLPKRDDGGMYRFFINKYSQNKSFGGMIGYIIKDSSTEILESLKTRIKNFKLEESSIVYGNLIDETLLSEPVYEFKNSFQSSHNRIDNSSLVSPVHLFHILFDFTK